jgi:hypothetical protein
VGGAVGGGSSTAEGGGRGGGLRVRVSGFEVRVQGSSMPGGHRRGEVGDPEDRRRWLFDR